MSSFLGSIFPGDKELGKKDDDHRPGRNQALPRAWSARKQVSGVRRRRIVYLVLVLLAILIFIKNIPTDLGPNSARRDVRVPYPDKSLPQSPNQEPPTDKPPHRPGSSEAEDHYHDGPIKFYKLAASLHAVATLAGRGGKNKNILFAASNLKSASAIMPIACEMAAQKRNDVHFAFMGRHELEIHEIREVNGINEDDCPVNWHDGRPDYARWSSDLRMEISVRAGLGHIDKFVMPQALIVDYEGREDAFFIKSIRSKALALGKSLIQLPPDAAANMMWVTRLDSGSLAAWQTTYIDLIVHAPPHSSGSLLRLLKSIEGADYFGYRRPHLTIEVPSEIDGPTEWYLQNLIWPPLDWSGAPHTSQVSLRRRIPKRTFTAAEASSHLVESFYPARPDDSHVLVLSTQTELSPLFYHYVMYNLLEYKYSKDHTSDDLMGISLELPTHYLNGIKSFDPPHPKGKPDTPTPFRWQAPNSNAALYFGDTWMEFHSFISNRISTMSSKTPKYSKQVSEIQPAWMEYLLELMRARGYTMLYPNYASTSSNAIATIHSELYEPPEEYPRDRRKAPSSTDLPPPIDPTNPFTADPTAQTLKPSSQPEPELLTTSLLDILPQPGDLPPLSLLPLLSYYGTPTSLSSLQNSASEFASTFETEIGGCDYTTGKPKSKHVVYARSTDDLFCNLDSIPTEEEVEATPLAEDPGTTRFFNNAPNIYRPHPQPPLASEGSPPSPAPVSPAKVQRMETEFSTHLQRQKGQKPADADTEPRNRVPEDKVSPIKPIEEIEDEKNLIPKAERQNARNELAQHLSRQVGRKAGKEGEATKDKEKKKEEIQPANDKKPVKESPKEDKDEVDARRSWMNDRDAARGAERKPGW